MLVVLYNKLMKEFYNYLNSKVKNKISGNSVEIIDGDFTITIINTKDINDYPNLSSNNYSLNKIQKIITKKYLTNSSKFVEELFSILNIYYKEINSIPIYSLNIDKGNNNVLFFEIEFNITNDNDLKHFLLIISRCNKLNLKEKKNSLNIDCKLVDNNNIEILQSNTKTRRLGYFKIIIGLFKSSNYYPKNYFLRKVEIESSAYN